MKEHQAAERLLVLWHRWMAATQAGWQSRWRQIDTWAELRGDVTALRAELSQDDQVQARLGAVLAQWTVLLRTRIELEAAAPRLAVGRRWDSLRRARLASDITAREHWEAHVRRLSSPVGAPPERPDHAPTWTTTTPGA